MNYLSDVMFWREATTVLAFGLFLGIAAWAYSGRVKQEFDQASVQILTDDDIGDAK